MSRYIKLADALRTLPDTCYLDEIDENMQRLPSIDIVFCKECKFWDTHTMQFAENNLVIARCKQWLQYSRMNGYCHNGERREP